jgi:hypothetical protein
MYRLVIAPCTNLLINCYLIWCMPCAYTVHSSMPCVCWGACSPQEACISPLQQCAEKADSGQSQMQGGTCFACMSVAKLEQAY